MTETSYVSVLDVDDSSTVNGKIEVLANGLYKIEPNETSGEASGETGAADLSVDAYNEYLHEWLKAEDAANDTMTEDIVENEFMPLIYAGDYESFPAEMLWNGMLNTGCPMTYDEWVAANS